MLTEAVTWGELLALLAIGLAARIYYTVRAAKRPTVVIASTDGIEQAIADQIVAEVRRSAGDEGGTGR